MRRQSTGWGIGVIIAVLISLALFLFNVLNTINAVAAMLLLNGLWFIVFGVAFSAQRERMYFVGWGLAVAVLSTFAFEPWQYALGLEVIAVLAVVLATVFVRPGAKAPNPAQAPVTTG
jgi:hypothetical protein